MKASGLRIVAWSCVAGRGGGPHPAIVFARGLTDRTKSVPNTGKYTGISRY
jgi:hypothetical protein